MVVRKSPYPSGAQNGPVPLPTIEHKPTSQACQKWPILGSPLKDLQCNELPTVHDFEKPAELSGIQFHPDFIFESDLHRKSQI
jgi:hypothetical protein